MTRLTPKLHSLTTLASPTSSNVIYPYVMVRLLYKFAQRCSLNRRIHIHVYGEYGIYGKIRTIKGKYAQIRVIEPKYSQI